MTGLLITALVLVAVPVLIYNTLVRRRNAIENATRLSIMLTIANENVAPSFPSTICARVAGLASSGSSDCRSRSPAVVSIARYMPPRKAPNTRRYGRKLSSCPARCCRLARRAGW